MATFCFKGDQPIVFTALVAPDGTTCVPEPGENFEVADVVHPAAVLHHLLEAIDDEAKKLVAEARGETAPEPTKPKPVPAPPAPSPAAPTPPE